MGTHKLTHHVLLSLIVISVSVAIQEQVLYATQDDSQPLDAPSVVRSRVAQLDVSRFAQATEGDLLDLILFDNQRLEIRLETRRQKYPIHLWTNVWGFFSREPSSL